MGLWLGISLLTIIEFLEFGFDLLILKWNTMNRRRISPEGSPTTGNSANRIQLPEVKHFNPLSHLRTAAT